MLIDADSGPRVALAELLGAAHFSPGGCERIELRGADPVLPTRYRVGTAAAAALAALGAALAELWQLRGGERQRIGVGLRAAAVSLRSAGYLRIQGVAPAPLWDPLSGFYPVRGGFIRTHCGFPAHHDALLAVLRSPPEPAALAHASASWDGCALEDAVYAEGGCAAAVRGAAQWARHPQASAVAAAPLLEIACIGPGPVLPLPAAARPLAGVRALDLTRVLAGPTCGKTLAEHGAEVLKISAAHLADSGALELDTGIGKLSARLDLRRPEHTERLRELVREADLFVQSYRPGALAGRGFAPAALAALRPGIVCVSLSAWGESGPWGARRGFDSLVQAATGMAAPAAGASGPAGAPAAPQLLPVSAIDYVSGYLMAYGAVLALVRRAREGGSWQVRVALGRVGHWIAGLGELAAEQYAELAPELPEAELGALLTELDSPVGRIRHLRPVLELSQTPGRWERPPVELGTHPASWPR